MGRGSVTTDTEAETRSRRRSRWPANDGADDGGADMIEQVVERWQRFLARDLPEGLDGLLADDVVFYSPVVYTPQRGKDITALYLQAAAQALDRKSTRLNSSH